MFKIRSPIPNDLQKLEQLFPDSSFIKTLKSSLSNKLACLIQFIIPPPLRTKPSIHLAIYEKDIIGYIILRCASPVNNSWQIDEIAITHEHRSKGIGEELLRYVLSVYGGFGAEHFLSEIDAENFPALSLFHECGFRRYAKVCYFEKEVTEVTGPELDDDFFIRPQTKNDLLELEKIELSLIPPELRAALGRSKNYFKEKKNAVLLIDKSRNLTVGWGQAEKCENDALLIELLLSPGWSHLYEQFLNTLICDLTLQDKKKLIIKTVDYITELPDLLNKLGFIKIKVKELLVRTIWQKVKEKKLKAARIGVPYTAPT